MLDPKLDADARRAPLKEGDGKLKKRMKISYGGFGFITSAGIGVFWFVWGKLGFWWGVLYGIFWPVWAGYRIAEWAWR